MKTEQLDVEVRSLKMIRRQAKQSKPMIAIREYMMENMFCAPKGALGRLGGHLMSQDRQLPAWVIDLLDITPSDSVLEAGSGPGLGLELAGGVGLPDGVLDDVDALRRAFLFTNQAGDATQALLPVVAIIDEEREVASGLLSWQPLLRILHRYQAVLLHIAADKVPARLDQALDDAFT